MTLMHRWLLVLLLGFGISAAAGPLFIRLLQRMNLRQSERPEGPASHLGKAGTPTMGGVILLLGWLPASLAGMQQGFSLALPVILVTVLCGLLGFLDDFIKTSTNTPTGLLPGQKVLLQGVIALLAAAWLYKSPAVGSVIHLPFSRGSWDLGVLYIPFVVFVLVGTVNAVNLTDGLDGLAAGTSLGVELAFCLLFSLLERLSAAGDPLYAGGSYQGLTAFSAAGAGALMGYLLYNAYPARVFMGDTGSLAIGGAIAMQALVSRTALLLPLMGVCFVASALSVILQVGSYKLRKGKRVFKMAPLHHHFELLGVSEPKITAWYMLLTGVFCALSLYIFTR